MQCPQCQHENRKGAKFCDECGTPLPVSCPACGIGNRPGAKFCNECGTSLTTSKQTPSPSQVDTPPATGQDREPLSYTPPHLAEKILTSRSALESERKQVTVLFCDLANSTAIAEQIGAEAMHTPLNRFFELALNKVHRYEGTINQFLGDGFMALFGAPISHEDHARRGVLTALALQHTLKEADLGRPYGVECLFRIGLNSGLVVVGSIGDNLRMDYSAIGDTTNLASRLQQQSAPGDILVSDSISRLVQGSLHLEALQPVEVKGKTELVTPYKVIGTLPRRSPLASRGKRTLSTFVGRERELAILDDLFEQGEAGQGQVIGIVGEAGQGKSRLLYEFRQRLEGKRITYLEGGCLSYGSSIPYYPIIDLMRNNCGITETDSPSLIYPIAYDFGQWHEMTGKKREAVTLYGKAKATIERMATAVEDEALRSTFLQSALVQEIHERAARLGE
jgi:class 3 adenylate cyclase